MKVWMFVHNDCRHDARVLTGEQRYDTMMGNAWENEFSKLLEIYRRLNHRNNDRTA